MATIKPEVMVTAEAAALWEAGELPLMVVPLSLPEMSQFEADTALLNVYIAANHRLFQELVNALEKHGEGDTDLMRQVGAALDATEAAKGRHNKILSMLGRAVFIGRKQGGPVQ